MLLGEDYQADLPQQRPRPTQPTPAEQQWLQHKALEFGELGSDTLVPEKITTASGHAQWCVLLSISSPALCLVPHIGVLLCHLLIPVHDALTLQQSATHP